MHLRRYNFCALALCLEVATAFVTEPLIPPPPIFEVTTSGLPLASGLIFLTPTNFTDGSAVIMTQNGTLIWSSPSGPSYGNFRVATLDSQPVLQLYNASVNFFQQGYGYGKVQIFDTTYKEIYSICPDFNLAFPPNTPPQECQADIHESYVTDRGSILMSAYNYTQADLTSIGGPADGWIYDGLFFEVDIKTQKILFSWSAAAHVPINATKLPFNPEVDGTAGSPFDYFHINSVQSVGDGYLVNSRHAWTVYKLDSKGIIEWQFEGSSGGDFELPAGGNFAWEHDPRAGDVTRHGLRLHMFDNASNENGSLNKTLGLDFHLDLATKKATLLKSLSDPNDYLSVGSQGDYQPVPNGNVFMGYGAYPRFKEYGPTGDVRMSTTWLSQQGDSYRTFKLKWEARPASPPILVAQAGSAFMSWNGATDVTSWQIYEGLSASTLKLTKTIASAGFETEAAISNSTKFVQVGALKGSRLLRKSSVVPVS